MPTDTWTGVSHLAAACLDGSLSDDEARSVAALLFHAYTLSEAAAFTVAHLGAGEFGSDDLAGNVRRFRREAQGKDAD